MTDAADPPGRAPRPHSSSLLAASMRWMDALWDDDAELLWTVKRGWHMTRESALYALGLLELGEVRRASRILRRVIANQFDMNGTPFDGTFRRAPEEPDPPADAVMWVHFDPNWRQFIGTTFATILDRYSDALDEGLIDALRGSITRAVAGEPPDRVVPTYSNIALMKAWLEAWTGNDGDALATEVHRHFFEHGAFLEYNSPTYYGIDLSALALWRSERSTPTLQRLGAELESALWRDIARFYHAGLRNLCGPFDRAYGMDMTSYATPLGLCIWSAVGAEQAPFPDPATHFGHPHDFCFAPCISLSPPSVPDDARSHLETFSGERTVRQTITDNPFRVATAWLCDDVMFGAQAGPASGIGFFQHHHATMHWRCRDGSLGWARLKPESTADATASRGELHVESTAPITFEIHPRAHVDRSGWTVDDRHFSVETNAATVDVRDDGTVSYAVNRGTTAIRIST